MADWLLEVPRPGAAVQAPEPTRLAPRLRSRTVQEMTRTDWGGATFHVVAEGLDDPGVVVLPGGPDGERAILSSALLTEREDLIRELQAEGRELSLDTSDGRLVAHAVAVWGEGAWERLNGEFATAVWCPHERTLLLAVDGAGARMIFWANTSAGLVASTRFEALMAAPGVSKEPDRRALRHYLSGIPSGPGSERTWLGQVAEIRSGRFVKWRDGEVARGRWWTFPELPLWQPKGEREAVERIRTVLRDSLRDRLRGHRRVAIALTGGMDSPPVAATAAELRDEEGLDLELTAVHAEYPPEVPSDEARLARAVAESLRIPFASVPIGDAPTWPMRARPHPWPPHHWYGKWEPLSDALANGGTIILNGRSGEMFSRATLADALTRGRVDEMFAAWRDVRRMGLPFRFWGRQAWLRPDFSPPRRPPTLTPWIHNNNGDGWPMESPEEAKSPTRRSQVPGRLRFLDGLLATLRRNSYQFEPADARVPTVDPFSDRRLIHLAASIAPLPWRVNKYLLRRAFEDELPREVVTRPRTPTPWFPLRVAQEVHAGCLHPVVREFVDAHDWAGRVGEMTTGPQAMLWLRPLVVSDWLRELEAR